jgi:Rps23 Pro-64 3,4-dihydroxylase Tpa1-like proline 4-hydroxylase
LCHLHHLSICSLCHVYAIEFVIHSLNSYHNSYLVPQDWCEADGGSLDLFNVDAEGQCGSVARSVFPTYNSFAFFEVSPRSWHQVREVLTDKHRLSISG